jgi:hypothetical protein
MRTLRNGEPQSPFALRRIDIYRGSIRPANLIGNIPFVDPTDVTYPSPAIEVSPGYFEVPFDAPHDLVPDDIYFDVWNFIGNDPGTADINDESLWTSQSGMFWLYDDTWIIDDELITKRLGFEPLDKKLRRGEIRTIEVAIHPLPKYDYDFNKITPIIPQLRPTMSIRTSYNELIIGDVPCDIGVRQGSHRNSPFVIQCQIDTRTLVRGTYNYTIQVNIGDSATISPKFYFTVQ